MIVEILLKILFTVAADLVLAGGWRVDAKALGVSRFVTAWVIGALLLVWGWPLAELAGGLQ